MIGALLHGLSPSRILWNIELRIMDSACKSASITFPCGLLPGLLFTDFIIYSQIYSNSITELLEKDYDRYIESPEREYFGIRMPTL